MSEIITPEMDEAQVETPETAAIPGENLDANIEQDAVVEGEKQVETQPESPQKRWAGEFETPEDLQAAYFRKNQELNELKRRQEERYEPQKPQEESIEVVIFRQKYQEALAEQHDLYGDIFDDNKIQKIAEKQAIRETRYALLDHKLQQNQEAIEKVQDPLAKAVDEYVQNNPHMRGVNVTPDVRKTIRASIQWALDAQKQQQAPRQPQTPPQKLVVPPQNKGAGSSLPQGGAINDQYFGLDEAEVAQGKREHINFNDPEAVRAYAEGVKMSKRYGGLM